MKVVLVTGASRGIGNEIARQLAKEGYKVIATYNNNLEKIKELQNEINCDIIKCDVSDNEDVIRVFEYIKDNYNSLYALINNAGISYENLIQHTSFEKITEVINTNLISVINLSKKASEMMIKEKQGKIVNISSIWGINGASFETVYSASKGGIITFTKALAKELGPSLINVNCISPGVINTDMLSAYTKDDINTLIQDTPLFKLGESGDIARAVKFLISEDANFITGHNLVVDGGFSL